MSRHLAFGADIEALDVLLVDDMRPMQTLIRSMLFSFGTNRVRVAETADDALQAMHDQPPHLVIAECRLKPRSGHDLLYAMRSAAMAPLCFVPMIMVTPQATRPLVEMSFRAGAHGFLVKPFSPSTLYRTLGRVLADDRPFRLEGNRYVIDGVQERLDALLADEGILPAPRQPFDPGKAWKEPAEDDSELVAISPRRRNRPQRGYGALIDTE